MFLTCLVVVYSQVAGCQQRATSNEVNAQNPDLIDNTFPEARAEIQKVLDDTVQSLIDRDADKLISYHEYGPKFTEFKNGMSRAGSEENEKGERGLVAAISAWESDMNDLKINVFGEVAVVTFQADFRPTIEGEMQQMNYQVTLVFVNTDSGWKIRTNIFRL